MQKLQIAVFLSMRGFYALKKILLTPSCKLCSNCVKYIFWALNQLIVLIIHPIVTRKNELFWTNGNKQKLDSLTFDPRFGGIEINFCSFFFRILKVHCLSFPLMYHTLILMIFENWPKSTFSNSSSDSLCVSCLILFLWNC